MSLGVAFRAFFSALSNSTRSEAIRKVLDADLSQLGKERSAGLPPVESAGPSSKQDLSKQEEVAKTVKPSEPARPSRPASPSRNDALTLLSVLQREARLVDLIQEPLDQFSDAQVGAAARPCLKQCRQVLQRVFAVRPLLDQPENSVVEVPDNGSAIRYQWVGEAVQGAKQGRIVHPGWLATKVELPQWTGAEDDSRVVAAAELERAV